MYFDLCSIINGKAASVLKTANTAHNLPISVPLWKSIRLDSTTILQEAQHNYKNGILRFSVVTSGRALSDQEVDDICKTYRRLKG